MSDTIDNLDNLRPLGDGREFTIVIDDDDLCRRLQDEHVAVTRWTPDLVVPDRGNVVLVLCHQLVSRAVRQQFRDASVLVVPVASFDSSPDDVWYTLKLLVATNFVDNCRHNRQWIHLLRDDPHGVLSFRGPGIDLRCRLHHELRAHTSLTLGIASGEWVSVGDYCEVSVTAPSQAEWAGAFTIDGYAEASGVLVAEDSRVTPDGADRIRVAKELRNEFVASGPVGLIMEGNVLRSLIVDGTDRTEAVRDVTNPEYGLHTVELGLGSNIGIAPLVDWRYNSQLNEGAALIHLGFGEGITGAHMDFIVDRAQLVPSLGIAVDF